MLPEKVNLIEKKDKKRETEYFIYALVALDCLFKQFTAGKHYTAENITLKMHNWI